MVKPTKKQILKAAELICNGDELYACIALEYVTRDYFSNFSEFKKFFGVCVNKLNNNSTGWYGNPWVKENQLARSLALLLYAEARNDVL